jgi:hypothetical protein
MVAGDELDEAEGGQEQSGPDGASDALGLLEQRHDRLACALRPPRAGVNERSQAKRHRPRARLLELGDDGAGFLDAALR